MSWYFYRGPDFYNSSNRFWIISFASSLNRVILLLISLSFYLSPRDKNLLPKISTGRSKVCLLISEFKLLMKTAIDWLLIFSWVEFVPKKHSNITFENIPAKSSHTFILYVVVYELTSIFPFYLHYSSMIFMFSSHIRLIFPMFSIIKS